MAFKKGNPGRPKGIVDRRSEAWKDLEEAIIDSHAGRFNQILADFMDHPDPEVQQVGAEMFLKCLEYFKPKQARVTHAGEKESPVVIQISEYL